MKEGLKTLVDFRGFLDMRYTVLCLGAFVSQFGIWIPNYYIGKQSET
jgi:MCP family monocarboxylic acid transporter-like MFS transporter 10